MIWRDPAPIVRESKISRRTIRTEKKSLKQKLLSKNNKLSSSGRINLGQDGDTTWAITISPKRLMDYRVMEQNVEPKLRGLIKTMVKKRYYTLSSCQSHGSDFNCYVTCALYNLDLVEKLEKSFRDLRWFYSDIKVMRPEDYINSCYDEKTDTMKHLKPNHHEALEAVNNMLGMQLDSVYIVQIFIRRKSASIFEDAVFWFVDRLLLDRRISSLTKIVNGLPSENFI